MTKMTKQELIKYLSEHYVLMEGEQYFNSPEIKWTSTIEEATIFNEQEKGEFTLQFKHRTLRLRKAKWMNLDVDVIHPETGEIMNLDDPRLT